MKLIFLVFGKSLLYATVIFFLVYFLFSVVFVSNLGPIAAFIVAADSFVLSFVVLLLVVSLRELKLRRMVHAAPLTRSEHELLKSTRIDLRVAVLDPKSSSAFTQGLIRDLQATRLFSVVREYTECENADVIARIKRTYWGQEEGQNFVFHLPERLSEGVEIDVFYELGAASPWNSRKSQRKQYLQRLSVELIKASQKLFGQDQPSSTDSTPSPFSLAVSSYAARVREPENLRVHSQAAAQPLTRCLLSMDDQQSGRR